VEYDGKSVSVIVIWGGGISDPQDRQRSTTMGVEDINWEVEPPPPPLPGTPTLAFALLVYLPFGKINIVLAKYIFKLILPGDS